MAFTEIFRKFNYYAEPEGHDPLNKVVGVAKYGAYTGLFLGGFDIMLVSKTTTLYDSVRCLGFYMVPLMGMGAAFASTTYIATNLRGKDDPWNYVIGACAAGGVYNLWTKQGLGTLYTTILLSIFAACKKDSIDSGWTFFPQELVECEGTFPMFQTRNYYEKKYERGWTT